MAFNCSNILVAYCETIAFVVAVLLKGISLKRHGVKRPDNKRHVQGVPQLYGVFETASTAWLFILEK